MNCIELTAREYLEQIKEFETLIHNKQAELKDLEELATSITAPTDREAVQTSNISDKVAECAAKIADMRNEIAEAILTFIEAKEERIKVIEQVRKASLKQYDLLFKHYIEYKPLTVVASELKLSYSYVLELHQEALKNVEKIL